VAITAGLRLGELLALRWPEVDLERHTLSVVATLEQRQGHEPVIAEPKTSRSRRHRLAP
jgi:integrase